MKNFYVTALYKIDQLPEVTYDLYKYLLDKSLKSVKKYLKGDYEIIVLDKKLKTFQEMYLEQYKFIYDLYKSNYPCNILYCGADVIFNNDCNIFNNLDGFRIFNYTCVKQYPLEYNKVYNNYLEDCSKIADNYGYKINNFNNNNKFFQFTDYLNCDIRYFSHNMDDKILDFGLELMKMWRDKYKYPGHGDQFIYNFMLWCQDLTIKEAVIPKYGYQFVNKCLTEGKNDKFNNLKLGDAEIVHVHLSLFIAMIKVRDDNKLVLDNILNAIENA